jgi:hypothetical protein
VVAAGEGGGRPNGVTVRRWVSRKLEVTRRRAMSSQFNRRVFVKGAAWGAAGWWILRGSGSARSYQANEKLNIAVVGVGNRGSHLARVMLRLEQNLAALCDTDRRRAESWQKDAPKVPWYEDFRRMLDEQDAQIDGVVTALSPMHNHGAVAAAAMRRGKHVFVEKPIGHNVGELRALRQIAGEQKVASQMGNQGMATDSFRRTVELVREGAIGQIREAYLWAVGGGPGPGDPPTDERPVPDYLNWDLWLGARPARPFHPAWMSGAWREFGTATLGGWGSHAANMIFMGLRLGALWGTDGDVRGTIRVTATPSDRCEHRYPRRETTQFDIPARGDLPPVRLHWYLAPRPELEERGIWQRLQEIAGRPPVMEGSWTPESGSMLAGSKGVVHADSHNSVCHVLPEGKFPEAAEPPQRLPSVRGHEPEWLDGCRGKATPISNLNHSGPMMEMLYLSHVAGLFPEQTIEYDPKQGKIVNLDEANRWLSWPRREGWEL